MAAAFAALGFLAQGMVNNLFTVPATGTLFAVVMGIIVAAGVEDPLANRAARRSLSAPSDQ